MAVGKELPGNEKSGYDQAINEGQYNHGWLAGFMEEVWRNWRLYISTFGLEASSEGLTPQQRAARNDPETRETYNKLVGRKF